MKRNPILFGTGNARILCSYAPGFFYGIFYYLLLCVTLFSGHVLLAVIRKGFASCNMDWRNFCALLFVFSIGLCSTVVFYHGKKVTFHCTDDGIYVLNNGGILFDYILWEDITYAYKTRNSKAYEVSIFSKHEIAPREIKRLVNWGAADLDKKGIFLLVHNGTKNADVFFEILKEHIVYVEVK